jgi:hypothetical protein
MKIRITIYELNSRGKDKITECQIFMNKKEASDFILQQKAEPKEYKRTNFKPQYTYDGI